MTRLNVARNPKLPDALDLVSDQSRLQPCSTSARREACLAWGTRSTAWVSKQISEKTSCGKTNESLFSCKKSDNLNQVERRWQGCLWSVMSVQSLHLSYPESASLPLVSASEKRLAAAKKSRQNRIFAKKRPKNLSQKIFHILSLVPSSSSSHLCLHQNGVSGTSPPIHPL